MATNYPPYVQPITTITNESTYYFGSSFNSFSGSTNNQNEKYFTSVFIPELNWIVYVAYRAVNIIIVNASTNQIVKSIYTNLNANTRKYTTCVYVPSLNKIYFMPSDIYNFGIYDVATGVFNSTSLIHPSTGLANKISGCFLLQGRYIFVLWYGSSSQSNCLIDTNDNSLTVLSGLGTQVGYTQHVLIDNIVYSICGWSGAGTAMKRYNVSNPTSITLVSGTPTTTFNNARIFYSKKTNSIYVFKSNTGLTTYSVYSITNNTYSTFNYNFSPEYIQYSIQDPTNADQVYLIQGGTITGLIYLFNFITNTLVRTINLLPSAQSQTFGGTFSIACLNPMRNEICIPISTPFGDYSTSLGPYFLVLPYRTITNTFNEDYFKTIEMDKYYLPKIGGNESGSLNCLNVNCSNTLTLYKPISMNAYYATANFSKIGAFNSWSSTNNTITSGTNYSISPLVNLPAGNYLYYLQLNYTGASGTSIVSTVNFAISSSTSSFALTNNIYSTMIKKTYSIATGITNRHSFLCLENLTIAQVNNDFTFTSGTINYSLF